MQVRLSGPDAEDDYFTHSDRLAELAQIGLEELGGRQLFLQAHDAAAEWVDQQHPWDGTEPEPDERVEAYTSALWRTLERERTARGLPT